MKTYTKNYNELQNKLNELGENSRYLANWCSNICRERLININDCNENREYVSALEKRNQILIEMEEIGKKLKELESEGKKYENN